jgi:hypothetical protein
MESWEVIKQALDRVGAKKVASRMRLSQSLVYRWAQPPGGGDGGSGSGVRNPLDRVMQMLELTEEPALLNWICERANGFFVGNPDSAGDSSLAVLAQTQAMIRDFSDLLEAVSEALANDESIDHGEAARIRSVWEHLKRLAESFTVACEQGAFG